MRSVDDELVEIFKAVTASGLPGKWNKDPMDFFHVKKMILPLCLYLAFEVLSVPVGEAPSERIFSIASRISKFDRSSISAEQVA